MFKIQKLHIGTKIYFDKEWRLNPKQIFELVNKLNNVSSTKLNYFNFLKDETAKKTRSKRIDRNEFIEDFNKITHFSISFFDKNISIYSNEEYNIHLTIFPKTKTVPANVELQFKSKNLADKIIEVIKTTFLKDFIYGFIFVSDSWNKTSMQTSLIPISPWKPGTNIFDETPEEKELLFYQVNQDKVYKGIFQAYWGNLLNKNHVEQLGGITKIKKFAPVFLVEELSNDEAYLQLTESPSDFGTKDYEEKLKQLDKFLEQIKVKEAKS